MKTGDPVTGEKGEDLFVKGHFFFSGGPSPRLMTLADADQIAHSQPLSAFDLVARQMEEPLRQAVADLSDLPQDPVRALEVVERVRREHPYLVISDEGKILSHSGLADLREALFKWDTLSEPERAVYRRHYAIRETTGPDGRVRATILISANALIVRAEAVERLRGSIEEAYQTGGFEAFDQGASESQRRVHPFWYVEGKDNNTKTGAWALLRMLTSDLTADKPIALVSVGSKAPSSIKDGAGQVKFIREAPAAWRQTFEREISAEDPALVYLRTLALESTDSAELTREILRISFSSVVGVKNFERVMRFLMQASNGHMWQVKVLSALREVRQDAETRGAWVLVGKADQALADAIDAGWVGTSAAGLVSNPEYAAEIAGIRNTLTEAIRKGNKKKGEYLLARLNQSVLDTLQNYDIEVDQLLDLRQRFAISKPSHPVTVIVPSTDDGGSSKAIAEALKLSGRGDHPPIGDQISPVAEAASADKRAHLLGSNGRIGSAPDFVGGVTGPIATTLADPEVKLGNDFFHFAVLLMKLARNVDRLNSELTEPAESAGRLQTRGASIRNIYLLGLWAEKEMLQGREPLSAAAVDPYQSAVRDAAIGLGLGDLTVQAASLKPGTLYAVYSGYTLMIRASGMAPMMFSLEQTEGNIEVFGTDPNRPLKVLYPGQAFAGTEMGGDLQNLEILNERGYPVILVNGQKWTPQANRPNDFKLVASDGTIRPMGYDGTGRARSREGSDSGEALITFDHDGGTVEIFLRGPIVKMQTHITETLTVSRINRIGLLAGEDLAGRIPPAHRIRKLPTNPSALESVRSAGPGDVIVLGPGSFFTSILPPFLTDGFAGALREAKERGAVVFVLLNLTMDNETWRHDAATLLSTLEAHAGLPLESFVTQVAGAKEETEGALADRLGIDPERVRRAMHPTIHPEIRTNPQAASHAAKQSRGSLALNPEVADRIRRTWPGLQLVELEDAAVVQASQTRTPSGFEDRVFHNPVSVRQAVEPLLADAGKVILVNGGTGMGALWKRVLEVSDPSAARLAESEAERVIQAFAYRVFLAQNLSSDTEYRIPFTIDGEARVVRAVKTGGELQLEIAGEALSVNWKSARAAYESDTAARSAADQNFETLEALRADLKALERIRGLRQPLEAHYRVPVDKLFGKRLSAEETELQTRLMLAVLRQAARSAPAGHRRIFYFNPSALDRLEARGVGFDRVRAVIENAARGSEDGDRASGRAADGARVFQIGVPQENRFIVNWHVDGQDRTPGELNLRFKPSEPGMVTGWAKAVALPLVAVGGTVGSDWRRFFDDESIVLDAGVWQSVRPFFIKLNSRPESLLLKLRGQASFGKSETIPFLKFTVGQWILQVRMALASSLLSA